MAIVAMHGRPSQLLLSSFNFKNSAPGPRVHQNTLFLFRKLKNVPGGAQPFSQTPCQWQGDTPVLTPSTPIRRLEPRALAIFIQKIEKCSRMGTTLFPNLSPVAGGHPGTHPSTPIRRLERRVLALDHHPSPLPPPPIYKIVHTPLHLSK